MKNMEKDKITDNDLSLQIKIQMIDRNKPDLPFKRSATRNFCVQQIDKVERKPGICHESSETIFSSR
jgi:hypothetical protein